MNTEFKEKKEQFYKDSKGNWIKCNEEKISSLWSKWAASDKALIQKEDKDGFTHFKYKNN